jgi:hypothetical protein
MTEIEKYWSIFNFHSVSVTQRFKIHKMIGNSATSSEFLDAVVKNDREFVSAKYEALMHNNCGKETIYYAINNKILNYQDTCNLIDKLSEEEKIICVLMS